MNRNYVVETIFVEYYIYWCFIVQRRGTLKFKKQKYMFYRFISKLLLVQNFNKQL